LAIAPITISNAGAGHNSAYKAGLALAALAGRTVMFTGLVDDNPRPSSGLGPGGITAAAGAAAVTSGHFEGGVGKPELFFQPGGLTRPLAGDYQFDVARQHKSAAALGNILEVLAPSLGATGADSTLTIMGGSHVMGGLTSDELSHVITPNWRALGMDIQYSEVSPGFFPRAKGEATVTFGPGRSLSSLQAEGPFKPAEVGVEVLTSGLPLHLAEQALDGAIGRLEVHGIKAEGRMRKARGGTGLAMLVWASGTGSDAYRVGFAALGQRGGRPISVATTAAEALVSFLHSGAGMPAHVATAMLPALTAATGVSRLTVDHPSQALTAAAKAIDAILPGSIRLDQRRPQAPVEIRITGMALT
jgi:RNA 3'-terminal phosphate cyclase (ATP)